MDTYTDNMIKENALQSTANYLKELYQNLVSLKKDYSFIIIHRDNPLNHRLMYCDSGIKCSWLKASNKPIDSDIQKYMLTEADSGNNSDADSESAPIPKAKHKKKKNPNESDPESDEVIGFTQHK